MGYASPDGSEKDGEKVPGKTAQDGQLMETDHAQYGSVVSDDGKEPQRGRVLSKRERHVMLAVMGVACFLGATQFSMVGPFYPQYASDRNASSLTIGVVVGSFEIAVLFSSPIWGSIIGTVGGKSLYISGVVGTSAFAVMFGCLSFVKHNQLFIVLSVVLRVLMGLCDGAYSVASYTLVITVFPDRVASVLGILEAFQATGIMVGPLIGGALYELGGFYLPFVVVPGLLIAFGLSITCIIPSFKEDHVRTYSACLLLTIPMLVISVSFQTTVSAIVAMSDSILAIHLKQFGLTPLQLGAIFLCGAGAYIICTPISGVIADKKPAWSAPQVMVGFTVAGVSLLLLGPAPFFHIHPQPLWLIIFSLLLFGCSSSVLVVAISLMFRAAQEAGYEESMETYGIVTGFLRSAAALGGSLGAIFGGLFFSTSGFEWVSTGSGIIFFIQVLIMLTLVLVKGILGKRNMKDEEDTKALTPTTDYTASSDSSLDDNKIHP